MAKRRFNWRGLTSLILVWSFVVETVSGVVLYIVPPGRIANWTNWRLFGLSKDGWGALHTLFGYLFLGFAVLHIVYNWRPIVNYIKSRIEIGIRLRKELVVSIVITIVFFVGTVMNISPFKDVMDFGEKLKNSWAASATQPVVSHAELLSFKEFVEEVGIELDKAKDILHKNGIDISNDNMLVKDIAEKNNLSPQELYDLLRVRSEVLTGGESTIEAGEFEEGTGGGYGRKTIEQIALEYSLDADDVIKFLESQGIEAVKGETLREVADRIGETPFEIAEMVKGYSNK